MSIVAQAKAFAEAKHARKVRKYTDTPYSEHLAAVVALLEEHGINMPNVLAAAWLLHHELPGHLTESYLR